MTDKIVEFINRKGIALDDLNAGVTIAAAGIGEQVVIKDLVISGSSRSLTLEVDNTTIGNVISPAQLTGSELIGEDTSLVARNNTFPLLNRVIAYSSGSSVQLNTRTLFSGDTGLPQGSVRSSSSYTSTAYAPFFACVGQNKDFYWSNLGRSSPPTTAYYSFYRRAGGVAGTETNLFSNCIDAAYDGERYIWAYSNASQGIVIDTATGAQSPIIYVTPAGAATSVSLVAGALSQSALIDGYVVLSMGSTGQVCLIELATGVVEWLDLSTFPSTPSIRFNIGINKTTSGEYVFVRGAYFTSATSTAYTYALDFFNLGTSLANPSVQGSSRLELVDINIAGNNNQATSNRIQRAPGVPNFLFYMNYTAATQLYIIDLITFSISTIPISSIECASFAIACDQVIAARDFGTVDIRATGIRSN